ncbi:MAG: patatin-like phospholipase family protein [Bacteroidota bacterium]
MDKKTIHFRGNATGFFNYIGCGLFLRHHYNLSEVRFSGCSSGSIISAIMALEVDFNQAVMIPFQLQPRSNNQLALMGNWKNKLETYLWHILPAHKNYRSMERIRVGVQFMDGFQFFNSFESKDDLINCLLASTHIPFFMNLKPFDHFRGKKCVDGALFSRHDRLKEKGTFYLNHKIPFIKGISLKSEQELIQLIKDGFLEAATNQELNNYLKEFKVNSFEENYLLDFLEGLKKSLVEEYRTELTHYISK